MRLIQYLLLAAFAAAASRLFAGRHAIENTYIPQGIYSDKVLRQFKAHLNPDYVNRYLTPDGTQNGLETKLPVRKL